MEDRLKEAAERIRAAQAQQEDPLLSILKELGAAEKDVAAHPVPVQDLSYELTPEDLERRERAHRAWKMYTTVRDIVRQ